VGHGQVYIAEVLSGQQVLTIGLDDQVMHARFSPDGRTLAVATKDRTIVLFDAITGRERKLFDGFDAQAYPFAFTADSRRLLSGHADGTILVWDVAAATRREPAPPATAAQLDGWWAALAGDDAAQAYAAVCGLADVPSQSVPLLLARLKSVEEVPAERIRQWVADLDSPRFAVREAAKGQLAELGELAEPALRNALTANPTLEQRQRIQALLDGAGEVRSPEVRRAVRAVWALERAGTPEAVRALEALAGGAAESHLAHEAREALVRLRR
jgi:hypothetical protein